ncbi:hypothetical protein DLJ88_01270 [Evtepia gabavorous]|uniref:MarR family transcriptional regulator n=2 Tax=Evtepia gabavorous TaxID=2211183 RepID=A0A3E2B6Z5_9FIRM|nr:MarR family transcriptional regulator [Evtepia gabavorous]TYK64019.1 hypothetical protein DLJ88_01270 [Evtepia gabavorous]
MDAPPGKSKIIISFLAAPCKVTCGEVSLQPPLFIDNSVRILYNFNCPNSNKWGEFFRMETLNHRAYQVTQLACIVNQLHRMAMRMPPDALPSGMTISQLSTIGFLYFSQQGDVYQKDIESFFKLRRSTVSSQLDTLEKKGLIQRVPVSHDARLKKLVLTEEGLRISGQVLLVLEQMNDFMIQGLSQEETVVLTNLLRKIEQNLSRIG